jgi:hypothetical protein
MSVRQSCRARARGIPFIYVLAALLAPSCDTTAAGHSEALAADFDQARAYALLERIVALGPRPAGTPKGAEQRDMIAAELASYGLKPVREPFEAKTPIGPLALENVYADIGGAPRDGSPAPLVILVTHFDTKRLSFAFLGANDAGSGTSVLLELARVLAPKPGPVTWRLLFVDGEESIRPQWVDPDNRYGSRHHAARLKETGELARVKACVLLDLIGDRDLRLTTELNSAKELRDIFFEAARANGLGQHVGGPSMEISDDHLSFLDAGIPSVDLIDFSYGPGNAYWHSPDDTLDKCSADSLGAIGRIVLHGLPALEQWALAR